MQWTPPRKKPEIQAQPAPRAELSQDDVDALRKFAEAIRAALPVLT